MCKCRSHGTFPLFGLQSSHLNICYYHQDPHQRPLRPGLRPRFCSDRRALLLIGAWHLPRRPGVGRALKRHPFSGLVDSADERFARRYRCGPPPEFPLASPRSGIVHHLSGPDRRVEWGAHRPASGARRCRSTPEARAAYHNRGDGVPRAYRERALAAPPIHAGPRPESIGGPARRRSTSDRGASPAPIRFPPDNFKHSLTLFSKSFSSFPRGTCSLSVSRPYLALDGIHRPIWAAFPNNPTRRQRLVVRQGPGTTGLSPSLAPPSRGLGPGPPLRTLLQTTIRTTGPPDSKAGLFPPRQRERAELQPPLAATSVDVDSHLGQPRARGAREASFRPRAAPCGVRGATRCVTPRQTCPRPNGFGRNLRSKTSMVHGITAIHTKYRISLRSSSMREPRYPLPRVVRV
ncbi:hypothetical protein H5410_064008 [Solanum commersonii]|uniref:Protein TAR1 n=1 Tax=Solanum commersonii TaxID=4109 RepID=A0A9J5W0T7_SOLCO|nr:hypothetical protein H5410_064008 [Solanum commersonii]